MTLPRPRPPYLQHGRRHSPTGSDPIPGLGGGPASAYLWTQTSHGFTGGSAGYTVKWVHFQTTDTSVFATNAANNFSTPYHNTTLDQFLICQQAGAFVVEATIKWLGTPSNVSGEIQLNAPDYLDDQQPTAMGNLASTAAPETSVGNLMTQSIRCFTVVSGDAPQGLYLLANGQSVSTYTITSASMVIHWLGAGIGSDTSVY